MYKQIDVRLMPGSNKRANHMYANRVTILD